jgi:outer membrane lipoprotein SlyB
MIIKKIALLMLTMFLVFAFAGKGSNQGEQIVAAVGAVTGGVIGAKVSSSDGKIQGIGLSVIRRSRKILV